MSQYHDKSINAMLEQKKENDNTVSAKKDMERFYDQNKNCCDLAHKYCMDFYATSNSYIRNLKGNPDVAKFKKILLVITSNKIERGIFIHRMYEYNKDKIETYTVKGYDFNIINMKNYSIVHVYTGDIGDEFAQKAINVAYDILQDKISYIVLLGICYGRYINKQNLGDVIISNEVKVFRFDFRDNKIVRPVYLRTETPNPFYIRDIKNTVSITKYTNKIFFNNIKVDIGIYVSSNSVMSQRSIKNELIKAAGETKQIYGGEMEANGIFTSNIFLSTPPYKFDKWLIIKSICDWGEAKNTIQEHIKDSIQAYAMLNSVEVFLELQKNGIFNKY